MKRLMVEDCFGEIPYERIRGIDYLPRKIQPTKPVIVQKKKNKNSKEPPNQ